MSSWKQTRPGTPTHRPTALVQRALVLIQDSATVGIIGLVDEATGYQETRSRRALATRILGEVYSQRTPALDKDVPL